MSCLPSVFALYSGSPDIILTIATDRQSQQAPTLHCEVVPCCAMHLVVVAAVWTRMSSLWASMTACHLLCHGNPVSRRHSRAGTGSISGLGLCALASANVVFKGLVWRMKMNKCVSFSVSLVGTTHGMFVE